ncbi:MAG TPA: tetratricopeptide repeat protein, partial [Pirellulales bacterium]|nr:tetratricopeptide repeat protein [Pirellulales bacterium]
RDATGAELLDKALKELDRSDELLPQLVKVEKAHADDTGADALRLFMAQKYLDAKMPQQAAPLFAALHKKTPSVEIYNGLIESYLRIEDADRLAATLADLHEKAGTIDIVSEPIKELAGNEAMVLKLSDAVDQLAKSNTGNTAFHARLVMGLVATEAEKLDLAGKSFEKAAMLKPRSRDVWREWGLALVQTHHYADAADVFRRGIESHVLAADNPLFHTYLAIALTLDDRYDEALAAAREAAEIGEHSATVESRIPWVLYHAKRLDEAKKAYEELIDRFDDDRTGEGVGPALKEARMVLSNICVVQNNLSEAEEWLEEVLDEYPNDVGALNDLGYLWADEGKHLDRALKMVQQAVDAEPENVSYRDSLGWAFYRMGRYPEAVEQLEKATAGEDPDGVILDHLGDAYSANKQSSKARATWKRAFEKLKKAGETDKAAQIKKKLKKS